MSHVLYCLPETPAGLSPAIQPYWLPHFPTLILVLSGITSPVHIRIQILPSGSVPGKMQPKKNLHSYLFPAVHMKMA